MASCCHVPLVLSSFPPFICDSTALSPMVTNEKVFLQNLCIVVFSRDHPPPKYILFHRFVVKFALPHLCMFNRYPLQPRNEDTQPDASVCR